MSGRDGKDWSPFTIEGCRGIIESKNGALLVEGPFPGNDQAKWVPKGLINDDSEVFEEGTEGKLIVPMWLAFEKGMV